MNDSPTDSATLVADLRRRFLPIVPIICFGFLSALSISAQTGPAGSWTGTIEVPGSPLSINLTLQDGPSGWSGTYSIPIQNIHDLPLESIDVSERTIAFALGGGIPGAPSFRLKLSEHGDRMSGPFMQGGATLPASFSRDAAADKSRPATLSEIREVLQVYIDSIRTIWKVPGLAVSVVRGEEELTIVSGLRDVEQKKDVTPRTQFAIGSTTKAFTATIIGTLVDEGLLDWDDPVIMHIPDFALHDVEAARSLRVKDLLTHTSGLPRHDILWYFGKDLSRNELLGRLRYLEPTARANQKWQYQNLMYMAAGILAERVSGRSWEELLTERILRPTGMAGGSTLDVDGLASASDHSIGYRKDEEDFKPVPYRKLSAIAPAGAINTSAEAITGWLRMNVNGGTTGENDDRVIEEGTLNTIQSPHVVMPGGTSFRGKMYDLYGYGWMISAYRGENLVHHGGAIDGFVAHISLLPEEKIGVAVMANRSTILPEVASLDIIDMVRGAESFDHAVTLGQNMELGPEPEVSGQVDRIEGTRPSRPLEEFTGRFADPAYDTVSITFQKGALWLEYFGNRVRLDHYHYDVFAADSSSDVFPGLRIMFVPSADGTVSRLSTPIESSLPPIEFVRLPDSRLSDPGFLKQYTGVWTIAGQTFTVTERSGRLLVDLPGQSRYTLEPVGISPDGAATFEIDGLTGFRVRFMQEDGESVALFLQPNGTFRATRSE